MSQKYTAHSMFAGENEREVVIESDKCRYWVWINEDEATIRGPGVRETGDFPETNGKLDDEDFAILIIMLFENGLWPEG